MHVLVLVQALAAASEELELASASHGGRRGRRRLQFRSGCPPIALAGSQRNQYTVPLTVAVPRT